MTECRICELQSELNSLPQRERIHLDEHWRVSHGWSSLEGWLVVCARRHVQALDELHPAELAELAPLLASVTQALRSEVGCERTYVVMFGEQPGFQHLHVHVIPRMPWFSEDQLGPGVFAFLNAPPSQMIGEARRDQLAGALSAAITEGAR